MLPQRVLEYFAKIFPDYKVKSYKEVRQAKNAIRIRLEDDSVLFFAWRPDKSQEGWVLSTHLEGIV